MILAGTRGSDKALIVDMKTPFPAPGFVARTHFNNSLHYGTLRLAYSAKGLPSNVFTVIIPCTGPIPLHTFNTLKEIGFPERGICKLIRDMYSAAAKANYLLGSTLQKASPQGASSGP